MWQIRCFFMFLQLSWGCNEGTSRLDSRVQSSAYFWNSLRGLFESDGFSWFIMHGALVPLPLLPLVLVQGMNTYVNWQNGLLQLEVRDDMGRHGMTWDDIENPMTIPLQSHDRSWCRTVLWRFLRCISRACIQGPVACQHVWLQESPGSYDYIMISWQIIIDHRWYNNRW